MSENIISVNNLTKDYGQGRGVFNINISVQKGECYGFLGPNGAGKTTTIRHLMGFSKPDEGYAAIKGLDCWKKSADLKDDIGYLPGEIALPTGLTGSGFLKMVLKMQRCKDKEVCNELVKRFHLNTDKKTSEMSLGEKRKLAIVAAFMHDPQILILDEPTSGLDPVMQQEFINFIKEEKQRGKTILLSSHIFHEVDAVCDRIGIIKSGKIVSEFKADELQSTQDSIYAIGFKNIGDYNLFKAKNYVIVADSKERLKIKVRVPLAKISEFANEMAALNIASFHQIPFSLEDYFMDFYKGEEVLK